MPTHDTNGWKESGHLKLRRGFFNRKHRDALTATESWVFVELCGQAEWQGAMAGLVQIPSLRKFADYAGVDRKTLRACITKLERLGYLEPTPEEGCWIIPKYA